MNEHNVLGVVLAGGKSQRFGQDKVEANLGNKTLIEHTLDKIKFKFEDVIIVSKKTITIFLENNNIFQKILLFFENINILYNEKTDKRRKKDKN